MAVRTRASGFRASGNWEYKNFSVTLSSSATPVSVLPINAGKTYNLLGFRIVGVFSTGASGMLSPAVISLCADNAELVPLWVCEKNAYEGLSYLESAEFGDGLELPTGDDLRIKTDVPFSGGGVLDITGTIWGRIG
tara:strand:- start:660 stop:1067 length:408 start_codon:yes stop_codon:yes gene_type:complete